MADRPLVSAVIIFLDAARFLQEAIESVLQQTYPAWELLLVDDGSTDGSTAIAKRFAATYPERIRCLEHEGHANRGKSTSRNLGIATARGFYVSFLDADDVWLPEKLEHQVSIIEKHPDAVMVYGPTEYWLSWSDAHGKDKWGSLGVPPRALYSPPVLARHFLAHGGDVPGICSLVARRGAIIETGGFEESIQHIFEDQTFLMKMCLLGPVYVDDACLDRYRQHSASSSRQAIARGTYHPWRPNPARREFLEWLAGYLKSLGNEDPEMARLVEKEMRVYRHPALARLALPFRALGKKIERLFDRS